MMLQKFLLCKAINFKINKSGYELCWRSYGYMRNGQTNVQRENKYAKTEKGKG